VREHVAGFLQEDLLVLCNKLLPTARRHGGIFLDAQARFHCAKPVLEIFLRHFHYDRAVHLHEAAESVIGEAAIFCRGSKTFHRAVIQAQIQNGFHHAWHGAR